jgi:hypothetical protein
MLSFSQNTRTNANPHSRIIASPEKALNTCSYANSFSRYTASTEETVDEADTFAYLLLSLNPQEDDHDDFLASLLCDPHDNIGGECAGENLKPLIWHGEDSQSLPEDLSTDRLELSVVDEEDIFANSLLSLNPREDDHDEFLASLLCDPHDNIGGECSGEDLKPLIWNGEDSQSLPEDLSTDRLEFSVEVDSSLVSDEDRDLDDELAASFARLHLGEMTAKQSEKITRYYNERYNIFQCFPATHMGPCLPTDDEQLCELFEKLHISEMTVEQSDTFASLPQSGIQLIRKAFTTGISGIFRWIGRSLGLCSE